jgi:hypothetical protein
MKNIPKKYLGEVGELYKVPYKYKSTDNWIKRRLIDIYLFIKDLLKKL